MARSPRPVSDSADPEAPDPGRLDGRALSRLLHHRWCLPALAEIHTHRGAKFVTLSRSLGVAPVSLKRALLRLAELDLIRRNPGYGHPMRPEYVLGPLGTQVDAAGPRLMRWIERVGASQELLKKWHLPTLLVLGPGCERFSEVRAALPDATPRAITLALKGLQAMGLVTRTIDNGYPPTPRYRATRRAITARRHAAVLGRALGDALFPSDPG